MTTTDLLTAARAEALFTSDLSAAEQPNLARIGAAIRHAVHAHGGVRGCAAEMAAAYGEHPATAAARMRWARGLVERTYLPRHPRAARHRAGRPAAGPRPDTNRQPSPRPAAGQRGEDRCTA